MSISIRYFSFNERRADEKWKNFADNIVKARINKSLDIISDYNLYNLAHPAETKDEDTVARNLKFLDLDYGSISCSPSDEDKSVYTFVESLATAANLEFINGILTKENWIKLYSMINKVFLEKAAGILMEETSWPIEDCRAILFDFLHNVRPVVKDLKENDDSIFISMVNNEDIEPDNVVQLLNKRAQKHLQNFSDIIG